MSRLHDEIERMTAKDSAPFPGSLHTMVREASVAGRRTQEGQADAARTAYRNGAAKRVTALREAKARLALEYAKLEGITAELHKQRHRAAFAELDLNKLAATLDAEEVALRKQFAPAYQLDAARAVLRRECERYEAGAPIQKAVNDLGGAPRDWLRTKAQIAWDEAASRIRHAIGQLDEWALGLTEPPKDLAVWLDDICDAAAQSAKTPAAA